MRNLLLILTLGGSRQVADVVITVDRLDRLADALLIARRSRRIALQSVLAGMALSVAAMLVAGAGYLPLVAGVVLQEAIDVAVIFNALRVLLERHLHGLHAILRLHFAQENERYLPLLEP